ncbi:4'-phosphopantetheinyl transferase family protein [Labedaea rhizosphaerae]|uniref:4'-phosphopantetheinyl transferase EntD n=1 Tax=Labedaea rhizosphaerae TaxID=598644 RepID=A0A4R6S5E6_LABRH|nr:4'-phosphopantetheinyl transferase superfamily protein [Labedaea rhizosphaerae]TDP93966.1 4'-phosphopantetheinyl transferase EntD [Labedaea rhizosphaerae]
MIDRILPAKAVAVEAFEDPPEAVLLPVEAAAVAKAVANRRREFTTVRHCARLAMAKLGVPYVPLVPGERGAPSWPSTVVGSMTHCAGYRAAVVAHATELRSVGVDAEPHGPLPDGVLDAVSLPAERDHLAGLPSSVHWDRLLFSAKESVYKAWFPITQRWLGFEEASLEFATDGTFSARLLVPGPVLDGVELRGFEGRWLVEDGFVLTAIAVPFA